MQNREPEFFEDDDLTLVPDSTADDIIDPETSTTPKPEEEEEEDEEKIDTTVVADDDETNIYKINYDILTEAGLELPEDYTFEPSEEGFTKAIQASKEYMKEKVIDELSQSLPAKGVELLNFMIETGSDDIDAFIESRKEPDFEALEVSEDDEDLQENLVRAYLKNTTKYSDERIDKEITRYKLDKELFTQASEAKMELAAMQKEQKAAFEESQKAQKEELRKQAEEATNLFKKTIEENTEINGVAFTKEDAKYLTESVFKPIKDKNGNITTKFNQQLDEVMRDPKKIAVLAKLLDKQLDLQAFKKPLERKAATTLKDKLEKAALPIPKGKVVTDASGFDWSSVEIAKQK